MQQLYKISRGIQKTVAIIIAGFFFPGLPVIFAITMQTNWEKYLKFRCTGCGNCCRDTVVCITDGDVKRIVEATGLSPLKFVQFYDHDEVSMSENDPLWISFADRKSVMGLRSTHDRCIFLDDKGNLLAFTRYAR
jgi:hypothetical protein